MAIRSNVESIGRKESGHPRKMKIYKNFIDKAHCNKLNEVMLGLEFPWFYVKHQVSKDSSFMFHCFYRDHKINSGFYDLMEPILKKLNVEKIISIRANLCLKRAMKNEWHRDFYERQILTPKSKVAIYYVNTNNGYTAFKDKKIKSEKNKIIIFKGDVKHKAQYQTDTDTRVVINFNYE